MAQHTIDLQANRSLFVNFNDFASNNHSADYLRVGDFVPDNPPDHNTQYALAVGFDYTQIPARKRLISAKVSLCVKSGASLDTGFRWAARPNSIIDEETTTYGTIFSTDFDMIGSTSYIGYTAGIRYGFTVPLEFITDVMAFVLMNSTEWQSETCDFYSTRAAANLRPYLEVVYEDVPPDQPTTFGPDQVYKDSTSIIRFSWRYNSSVGGEQKKFDFQWSKDGVNWNTVSQTTPNNYYDMPANTLPASIIYWRVRTYNEYDEVSGYSDVAAFHSIAAPVAPVIQSVSNACRPTVTWASSGQQLYEIRIFQGEKVVYETGVIPGPPIRTNTTNAFLQDGSYIVKIRIKNEYDLWSEWASRSFTIATVKPGKPNLSIQRSQYGLELTVAGEHNTAHIYRDGVCVATVEGEKYIDNTVANGKEYQYFVRALSENGFTDSDIVLGVPSFYYGLLNAEDEVIELKHNIGVVPGKSTSRNQTGTMNMYDGRKYPVPELSTNVEQSLTLVYFFRTYTDVEKIIEIADCKETILYRDKRGRKMYGVITGISIQDIKQGHNVSISISAVDHDEAVEV